MEPTNKSNGALVGSIIIVIILIIGGIYLYMTKIEDKNQINTENVGADAGALSGYDDIITLEQEMNTDINGGSADFEVENNLNGF